MSKSDRSRPSQASEDALAMIRRVTAPCHASLEREVDWMSAMQSAANYVQLLCRFLCVVEPLERLIQHYEPVPPTEPQHYRSQQLRSDIDAVGRRFSDAIATEQAEELVFHMSVVSDRATALGALYVLEGSALGGQILSRQVRDAAADWLAIDKPELRELEYQPLIDSYFIGRGAATGRHWRGFCERINIALSDEVTANMAATAASRTFELFHSSLTGKKVCVRP